MAQQDTVDKLLRRPLYVFDIPEDILYSLQLKTQPTSAPEAETSLPSIPTSPSPSAKDSQDDGPSKATSCALCGLSFASLLEQRSHIRSDLHGYNLKQKIRGKKALGESEFEQLVGQLDESISGSDTSDTEDDEDEKKDSTLSALLKRQAKITDGDADDAPSLKRKRGSGQPPMIWFSTPKLPSNTSLGVYRSILTTKEQEQEDKLVETIRQKQLAPKPQPSHQKKQKVVDDEEEGGVPLPASMIQKGTSADGPHYFLCMIGGGHFAAMIVSLTPKLTKKAGTEDRSATVIAHKTFHRYTTRRKQGGSQSANDNAKGNAHSAGSSIRRYNETALIQEVRDLLAEWKPLIDSAELLFIRASGTTNRRTLFGPYEEQVLSSRDDRIRGFPFNTRRATQSELMRAFIELTRIKVSTVDEAALARQAEQEAAIATAKADALANSKVSTSKSAKVSKEDEEAALHTQQIQALIRRSKAPGVQTYIQSNKITPDFRFFPPDQNHHAPTPLHLAAASNSPACVSVLLLKAGADPSIRNDDGKSAFDISGDRATRDAFRLARAQLGEAKWPWDAAGVPAALSQADADARTAREKEEKAAEDAAEKKRREAEMDRIRKEDTNKQNARQEKKYGKGHTMAKPQLTAEERRAEEARGMTDEMRMRLEREKRARAAEERMKRLAGK
ncbi:Putative Zinc finger C2H2-type, ankyrin repeat-containing domain superfamily [Septoria linicola]|uniref:Zinc finger C2H2-type, ankyrin repeat-containing domain superfamily n=1 Tax=Septoria linicola TaxID=215465 RepID=A0A9Q9ALX2_9PEZI|nr:putative Zinc finger C2H2-type, ankyrin repeat-containing domain superfamily [Septoria linicola]USW51862.1 Putative Zinc finger C2H2-type, ankyrin repeat-containing domain superfamily [Septoria linicola]